MNFLQRLRRRRIEGAIAHIRRQLSVIDEVEVHLSTRTLTERHAMLSSQLGELEQRLDALPA